jgi:hypothetical protein
MPPVIDYYSYSQPRVPTYDNCTQSHVLDPAIDKHSENDTGHFPVITYDQQQAPYH